MRPRLAGDRFLLAVASLGGVGRLPLAPGTWGSLATLPLWWGLSRLGPWAYGLAWLLLLAAGLWASHRVVKLLGERDPQVIVIDEAAGQLLALAGVTPTWWGALWGLVLFRAMDILKPWPVRRLEQLPGGFGVMADDLAAGALAWVGVQGVLWLFAGGG